MAEIKEMLAGFVEVANNPKAQLDKYLAEGKRVIGVGPYHVPEELVHAAGAVPFGVWGAIGSSDNAKKYFPPFYCSICQMTLEMGMTGKLNGLSGMMITGLCDTLRAFSQNWKAAMGTKIPMIYVSNSQNRFIEAGRTYAIDSYKEVKRGVEECSNAIIENDDMLASIKLYNEWRAAMREFVELAGTHPAEVSVADRVAVINAGYYELKEEHLARVKALNAELAKLPESTAGFNKIVLSGIYEDIPAIVEILDTNKYAVVADDLAKESRAFSREVPEAGCAIEALADGWCNLKEDPELFDPKKAHLAALVKKAKESGAQGVVILLAKFCDPEEFEAPLATKELREAGIPVVTIEVDQSTESYEQARTQLETFKELLA
ncbi:2-hydroxyacyl-CoA dehydratase subunit D [Slackia isoflavoniconvertens]|uniref:2-hydroxyacyl-CoA dehydratase subunit D n=1 Tax=Slackia isoflavoniconvertens TaxID=572010 RepID=UPI003AEFB861